LFGLKSHAKLLTVFLVALILCSVIHFRLEAPFGAAQAGSLSCWQVHYEGKDESAYRFNLSEEVSGLEIRLYIQTSPEDYRGYGHDWIRFTIVGKPVEIATSQGTFIVEPIVGLTRIGYEGDNEKSVGGLHAAYYVLPKRNYVNYVNVTVHAPFGEPRLDTSMSYVKAWDPHVNMVQLTTWTLGWFDYNVTGDGRARTALVSFGLPVNGQPMESGLTFSFGKAFTPPRILWRPDIYVEVGYAGGINIAPESFVGTGNYSCRINVGIGNGSSLNNAIGFGLGHTVYKVRKGDSVPPPAEEAASGSIDVLLEIGQKLLSSPAAKTILEALGYALFVYDLASIVASLGFDETVAESEILVFKDVNVGNEQFFAWFNFYAQIKSAGLSGGIVNFWGKFPFGSSIFDSYGFSVTDLPDGGMQVGGILLDYYAPDYCPGFTAENIVTIRSDGQVFPITTLIASEDGRVYYLTRDANASIIVDREFVTLDGCGHTLNGGVLVTSPLSVTDNVTIKSLKITGGLHGLDYDGYGMVFLRYTFSVTVTENQIADCKVGIMLNGMNGTITRNNLTHTDVGICVEGVDNLVSENNVVLSGVGISLGSDRTNVTRNHLRSNGVGVEAMGAMGETMIAYNEIMGCESGIVSKGGRDEFICENTILNCTFGIDNVGGYSISIFKNHIANCKVFGIRSISWEWGPDNIFENEILNCGYGVIGGNFTYENNITDCYCGIGYGYGNIAHNNIVNASIGIFLTGEEGLAWHMTPVVQGNSIIKCRNGTLIQELCYVVIRGNNYISNHFGVYVAAGRWQGHEISENNFVRNKVSIFVESGEDVRIFHNNFIENGGAHGDPPRCIWDNGYPSGGNYWSDYNGTDEKSGENQDMPGSDGIGDKPYTISGKAVDRYPLMEPCGELPPLTNEYTVHGGNIISLTSNSTISNFRYTPENHTISFYVQWRKGSKGFVDIKIPKGVENGKAEVLFDGKPIPFNESESADFIILNFVYEHSKHEVAIRFRPEAAPSEQAYQHVIIAVGATAILLSSLAILVRKRRARKC